MKYNNAKEKKQSIALQTKNTEQIALYIQVHSSSASTAGA